YLWKLSYLFGRQYSHYSLAFEDLVRDPDFQLRELCDNLNIEVDSLERMKAVIASPPLGKWKDYADDEWFRRQEAVCEMVLAEWLDGMNASAGRAAAASEHGRQQRPRHHCACSSSES